MLTYKNNKISMRSLQQELGLVVGEKHQPPIGNQNLVQKDQAGKAYRNNDIFFFGEV